MPRAFRIACLLVTAGFLAARLGAQTVSVLYFANTAKVPDFEWLSKGLADMLTSDLSAAKELTIVEREELEKVLKEQELSLSGLASDAQAVGIGKLLNARKIVSGGFIVLKDSIRIDAKAIDSTSGAVTGAASASGKPEELLSIEKDLAAKLLAALGCKPASVPAQTGSLEAAKTYYSGLMLYDSGEVEKAIELFKAAAAQDPAYLKPQKSIEASYAFLKDFKRLREQGEMSDLAADISLLKARLAADRFFSYADMVKDPRACGFADADAASAAYQANPRAYYGDTPLQALVGLEDLYRELGDLAHEYFEDEALADSCYAEQARLARLAAATYPKDPFLPEALYRELFSLERFEDWKGLKAACERLMLKYPKFRMNWAVEDFYERSLERMKEGGKK